MSTRPLPSQTGSAEAQAKAAGESNSAVRWLDGPIRVQDAVQKWLQGSPDPRAELVSESPHRRLVRLPPSEQGGEDLLVKLFLAPSAVKRARERIKGWLGLSPADREWRALRHLRNAGLPVPEPLGRARLATGERLLVMRFLPGQSLAEAIEASAQDRRAMLCELGELTARLHSCGRVHGDLHMGNVWVAEKQLWLLDFQRSRHSQNEQSRLRELGELDWSMRLAGVSQSNRLRARLRALSLSNPHSTRARRLLRAVGEESEHKRYRYFRSRTRRSLKSGRLYRPIHHRLPLHSNNANDNDKIARRRASGMRVADFSDAAVEDALRAHAAVQSSGGDGIFNQPGRAAASAGRPALLKRDSRARISAVRAGERWVVVKEVVKGGLPKRIADAFRGSPARRSWLGGHGLRIRGIRAARPLAYVEEGCFGIPLRSAIIMEDLRHALPLNELRTESAANALARPEAEELMDRLCELALELHRNRGIHGDLQALHIYLERKAAGPQCAPEPRAKTAPGDRDALENEQSRWETVLIDLDGVRFPRRLSDAQRLESLAQLEASLAPLGLDDALRERAFQRYARALPFAVPRDAAALELKRRSAQRRQGDTPPQ